jgi:predicted Ser/Thr protein kinase
VSALKICPQCGTEYELDQRFCPKDGSTLRAQGGATADLIGSIIADRYHVLKKLGEGGMGTVYLAEHVKMGRKSAVKVMNPGMVNDADAIGRFNREAANASKISHPNVAAVYDFGETTDGLIYLAMEYIEGPSLTKVIEESGALPPLRAADIARQASEALAVAHDMGIVHRDLKPDNIMLTKNRDGSDCVKVVDFGIAKAVNSEAQKVTKTGLVVGTPEYMSPEQLAGDKLDGRSDTYSLGLVAFAMMTGKLPFPAETVQESMIARLTDKPKLLSEMKPEVQWSEQVQAVMDKVLERDLNLRYQSANEFGRDLYKTVSGGVRPSGATKMVTAFVPSPRPAPAAAGAAPAAATPPKAIPQTRLNPATPAQAQQAVPHAPKNKMPMMVVVGVIVIALAGTGAAFVMKSKGGDTKAPAQQGDTTKGPLNQPLPSAAPAVVSLSRAFEQIEPLTDFQKNANAQTASQALGKLDSIAVLAQSDSDRVHIWLLQAESHFVKSEDARGSEKGREKDLGCSILKDHEGKADGTRFKSRFDGFLYGDKKTGLAAIC